MSSNRPPRLVVCVNQRQTQCIGQIALREREFHFAIGHHVQRFAALKDFDQGPRNRLDGAALPDGGKCLT